MHDINAFVVQDSAEFDLEIFMTDALTALIEATKKIQQTPQQLEQQRRSFAYGNTAFENADITRAMINEQADRLAEMHAEVPDRDR
jgi:predicted YcjX-like family ATPase